MFEGWVRSALLNAIAKPVVLDFGMATSHRPSSFRLALLQSILRERIQESMIPEGEQEPILDCFH